VSQISERSLRRSPLYSEQLGIALGRRTDREYFKWFLASLLFGARISETIAGNTYRAFARHRLLTPRKKGATSATTVASPPRSCVTAPLCSSSIEGD
jgi:hypothetical protein